jgi:small-conductance mechanosensitive channel
MGYYQTSFLVALTTLSWLLLETIAPEAGPLADLLAAATYFLTAVTGANVAEKLLMSLLLDRSRTGETTDLLRGLTSLLIYSLALLLWLRYALGFDVTNLLATSAAVTVVVGLAMQSTLGSLFSGLSLELEHPLRVGDHIRVGGVEGRVEALRWRSVLVATAENTWTVVPNVVLTSQIIEVIRRDVPSRMAVPFLVPADVPPARVISVAREVLKSDIPMVLRDPSPSVLLVGTESENESLRYVLRFYSRDFLQKSTLNSLLLTRLWYALSREGVEMRADCAALQFPGFAPGPCPSPAKPPPLEGLPAGFAAAGARLAFGPREQIAPGLFGFVIGGSASEEMMLDETDMAARVTELLERPASSEARTLIPEPELAAISERATHFIGPLAKAIAERCARLSGDPYLVYHALARSIASEEAKRRFLADAPAFPTRPLIPVAPFGWAGLLGIEPSDLRRRIADEEVEVLVLRRPALAEWLRSSDAAELAAAISPEPGLAGCDRAGLVEKLAAWAIGAAPE